MSARQRRKPQLAVLVDPDKFNPGLIRLCRPDAVSFFFVGGSRLQSGNTGKTIRAIRKLSKIPVVIFPGDETQVSGEAHAILLLSLLSGRNPDYLIGKHVLAAPVIRRKKLECIPTAYLLIDGRRKSVTQQVTHTRPLHSIKEICDTALAGQLLGFRLLYLEAGSGALRQINTSIIRKVRKTVELPLIVGGGIDSAAKARAAIKAGADIIVVGNALEKDAHLVEKLAPVFGRI
jgi:phosphoglycerol geranylgeranyltransferase